MTLPKELMQFIDMLFAVLIEFIKLLISVSL